MHGKGIISAIIFLMIGSVFASPTFTSYTVNLLCGIANFIRAIVGVLALTMFMLSGVFYAIGHLLPSQGQIRASVQGWAMGMMFAGIVALILFIIAVPLISFIESLGVASGGFSFPISCP